MMQASWKGVVLARSEKTVVVDGNHYFPAESLDKQYFQESATETVCGWKGTASYLSIQVGEEVNKDAAWVYHTPKQAAAEIKDAVAFWRGVAVSTSSTDA